MHTPKFRSWMIGGLVGLMCLTISIGSVASFLVLRAQLNSDGPLIGRPALRVGTEAPDFTTTDLRGNRVRLSDYRGRPVLLRMWSPDCPHCRGEIPSVKHAYATLEDNLVFLTVAVNTPTEEIRSFVQEREIQYPVLLDEEGEIASSYRVTAIPTAYLIGPDGTIVKATAGAYDLDPEQIEQEAAACAEQQCTIRTP
jgi:peroxiredoxin